MEKMTAREHRAAAMRLLGYSKAPFTDATLALRYVSEAFDHLRNARRLELDHTVSASAEFRAMGARLH